MRILVGFPPGGTSDSLARVIATAITTDLGRPVIVENKPGANGNLAAAEGARAPADGLTLYVGSFNNPVNHAAQRELPFDFMRDFAPVALIATVPNVLIVNKQVPAQDVRQLISLAKRSPGRMTFASAGAGSSLHMAGELFKHAGGLDMVHVPYKGSAPALADLMGGHVDMIFDNLPSATPLIQAGEVRALAVTGASRAPSFPELPTIAEAALPGFDVTSFFAFFAPASTPPAMIRQINAATNAVLAKPEIRATLAGLGAEPAPGAPEDLRALTEREVKKWREVIQKAQIQLE
ncbi:tripartite tricarboxylate transporter substrate binding protein [Teichococcus wenyumeiae]|uniref:tripartite tricarboxylate transporter substrate binding protein n=1 Tax=Teichococcus wenyumeiae TaxID=2478470 RepID=UPI0018F2F994|nr:tripartite tricarboxylate transporter substrate binding protein [Pseudoroseomonas wenyumeiae]